MNLFEEKGYGLACDKCGLEFSHGGRTLFSSVMAAAAAARSQGWKAPKASPFSDLCPKCRKVKK